jgi:sortase A
MKATLLAILLGLLGLGLLGRDGYLRLKAVVATRLVAAATDAHLADGDEHVPWAWADFHPVGRLLVPRLGLARPILSGGTGQTMAFGLGHAAGTGRPGGEGNVVVAGHRDSFGAFLGDLQTRDLIVLATADGDRAYRVADIRVVPDTDVSVTDPAWGPALTLVTCSPVEGLLPTHMRLVVRAEPVPMTGPVAAWPGRITGDGTEAAGRDRCESKGHDRCDCRVQRLSAITRAIQLGLTSHQANRLYYHNERHGVRVLAV